MKRRNSEKREEWREAVEAAAGYGPIAGGLVIDVARCDRILERDASRGILPSRDPKDPAIDWCGESTLSCEAVGGPPRRVCDRSANE
jgi:hypothetical protein